MYHWRGGPTSIQIMTLKVRKSAKDHSFYPAYTAVVEDEARFVF